MTTFPSTGQTYQTRLRYTDKNRALYIADKYAPILIGSVLDLGCGEALLRKLVHQPFRYVGADARPDADVNVDLERAALPFPDRRFDTVVCADLLARVACREAILVEACRVAIGRVILSAPHSIAPAIAAQTQALGFVMEQTDEEAGVVWWVLRRAPSGRR